MRYAALALAFLAAVSCAHTSRRAPAAARQTFAERCEKAAKRFLTQVQIDAGNPRQMSLLMAALHLNQYDLPNRARRLLAVKEPSCSHNKALKTIESELAVKFEEMGGLSENLAEFAMFTRHLNRSLILKDTDFARNTTCVARCASESDSCDRQCGVSNEYVNELTMTDGLLLLVGNCVDFEEEFENELPVFEQIMNNYRPRIMSALEKSEREAMPLAARAGAIQITLNMLLPLVQVAVLNEHKTGCEEQPQTWEARARGAIALLRQEIPQRRTFAWGTGFYVRSGDETRMVTAEHVYNAESKDLELNKRWIEIIRTHKREDTPSHGVRAFEPQPGLFDKSNDIIQTRVSGEMPSLEVVKQGTVPKKGQRFFIAGYPGGEPPNYKLYECTFLGFDRSFSPGSEQVSYVLNCPGVLSFLAGMSGGPMLDDKGQVWGVISEHSVLLSRVYVSPIAKDNKGQIEMGIHSIYHTDLCFRDNLLGYKRCQVMPGMYSTH